MSTPLILLITDWLGNNLILEGFSSSQITVRPRKKVTDVLTLCIPTSCSTAEMLFCTDTIFHVMVIV